MTGKKIITKWVFIFPMILYASESSIYETQVITLQNSCYFWVKEFYFCSLFNFCYTTLELWRRFSKIMFISSVLKSKYLFYWTKPFSKHDIFSRTYIIWGLKLLIGTFYIWLEFYLFYGLLSYQWDETL